MNNEINSIINKIINDAKGNIDKPKIELKDINILTNITPKEILQLNNEQMRLYIQNNLTHISKQVIDNNNYDYIDLFIYENFVRNLLIVISESSHLTDFGANEIIRICLNRITYYYNMYEEKTNTIQDLLLEITKIINKSMLLKLRNVDLSEYNIAWLCIARYASNDIYISIRRVNLVLINMPERLVTEETVLKIYRLFFKNHFKELFCVNMVDFPTGRESWINDMIMENDSMLGLCSLVILQEDHTVSEIKYILREYVSFLKGRQYRFSLNAMSPTDYYKVVDAKEELELENIFVP